MFSAPMMVLLDTNFVLDHEKLRSAIQDIHKKGFDTACIEFRNCLYNEYDTEGKEAVKIIVDEAQKLGVKVVKIMPYPGGNIIKKCPDARQKLIIEHKGRIKGNQFTIDIKNMGSISFASNEPTFQGIHKAFLIKRNGDLITNAKDITSTIKYTTDFNVFATVTGTYEKDGEILIYARYDADLMDFSSQDILKSMDEYIAHFKDLHLAGYAMDEFGTGCRACDVYFAGDHFLKSFREKYGYELSDKLYLLKNEAEGECSGKLRYDYYNLTIDNTWTVQKYMKDRYTQLYGKEIFGGFHHTWWGEGNSGDLWSGNIDYFRLAENLKGGFVDAQYDAERTMVSMCMLAESLAKYSDTGIAYNMCWDRNPTHGKLDYFHRLMAIRNVRWIGHAYGGTGSFGPGYPDHSTWDFTEVCTHREKIFQEFIGKAVSKPKVAMMYLWESVACFNNEFMHYHRLSMKALLDKMLQRNIEIDIIPTFDNDLTRFDVLMVLWPSMMPESTWSAIKNYVASGKRVIFMGPSAECTVEGRNIVKEFEEMIGAKSRSIYSGKEYNGEYEYVAWDMWFTDKKIPMQCFPLTPVDCNVSLLHDSDVVGMVKKNVEYYAFELPLTTYFNPVLSGLEKYSEINLPEGIFSKVSYDGDISVISLTGQWGSKVNCSFEFMGNRITIKDGMLVGIKLKDKNVIEIISEKNAYVEVNSRKWDYSMI